jgi:hypothetical protein
MLEALAQPKPTVAPHTNHLRAHLRQYKSSKEMQSLRKIQVEDWEDEAFADEAVEEEELARVQQEIERIHQEHETITRR